MSGDFGYRLYVAVLLLGMVKGEILLQLHTKLHIEYTRRDIIILTPIISFGLILDII